MKYQYIVLLIIALAAPIFSSAQCKSFVKKQCIPALDGYTPSDKYNSLRMVQGEEADVFLVFVANHDYRVLICSQPILGDVLFEVLTENGQVIYSSAENESEASFDFSTTSTEKLHVVIKVPDNESSSGMMHEGCVSVMIGSLAS
jgi:hypothetical protein